MINGGFLGFSGRYVMDDANVPVRKEVPLAVTDILM